MRVMAWGDGGSRNRPAGLARRELDRVLHECRQAPASPLRDRLVRRF